MQQPKKTQQSRDCHIWYEKDQMFIIFLAQFLPVKRYTVSAIFWCMMLYVLNVPIFIWSQGFSTALGMSAYSLQPDMSFEQNINEDFTFTYTVNILLSCGWPSPTYCNRNTVNSYLKRDMPLMWLAFCRILQLVLKTIGVRIHKRNNK